MSDAAEWEKRRDGLAQVLDYYEEAARLVRMAQDAAEREDETDLVSALMMLSELEGPPDGVVEVDIKSDKPDQGFWN